MIAVSACLVGIDVKYSGGNNKNEKVLNYLKGKEYITICPEVLGGLSTPRAPSEQIGEKVINDAGEDVTNNFYFGAKKALDILVENNVTEVILKSRSPSCGLGKIYDGTFSHTIIDGYGVFARMLLEYKNIKVYTEEDL